LKLATLRVVTPIACSVSPPRVLAVDHNLSPRNLSGDFWDMRSATHVQNIMSMPNTCYIIHPQTGKEMEYQDIMKVPKLKQLWERGMGKECGQKFQGLGDIKGTNTFFFVETNNIPNDHKITYCNIVCDLKPHKKEQDSVIITFVGNRLDYTCKVATPTSDITTFKILINSTLSTEDAEMMIMDINSYYVGHLWTDMSKCAFPSNAFLVTSLKECKIWKQWRWMDGCK
jgi:hypothetical protein